MCHTTTLMEQNTSSFNSSSAVNRSSTTTTTSSSLHPSLIRSSTTTSSQRHHRHHHHQPTTATTSVITATSVPSSVTSSSSSAVNPSPVSVVVAVAGAGRRAFEPQRVISDYSADIIRFAQPSKAYIKTYGTITSIPRKISAPSARHFNIKVPGVPGAYWIQYWNSHRYVNGWWVGWRSARGAGYTQL